MSTIRPDGPARPPVEFVEDGRARAANPTPRTPHPEAPKRTFGLTELAVGNGTSVFLLTLMILLFGLLAYDTIP